MSTSDWSTQHPEIIEDTKRCFYIGEKEQESDRDVYTLLSGYAIQKARLLNELLCAIRP